MKMLLSSIEIGAREDKERGSQSFQMFCKCHLWESLRPADHFDMDRCCCFKHNLLASVSPVGSVEAINGRMDGCRRPGTSRISAHESKESTEQLFLRFSINIFHEILQNVECE